MANLSHLLGNVYGDEAADAPTDDPSPDDAPADSHPTDEESEAEAADAAVEETPATEDAPSRHGPDWASEERLDAAFGDWTAGEMPEMERDEREALEIEVDEAQEAEVNVEADVNAEAEVNVEADDGPVEADVQLQDLSRAAESPAPEAPATPVDDQLDGPRWELTHDDILPARGGGLLSLLRRG